MVGETEAIGVRNASVRVKGKTNVNPPRARRQPGEQLARTRIGRNEPDRADDLLQEEPKLPVPFARSNSNQTDARNREKSEANGDLPEKLEAHRTSPDERADEARSWDLLSGKTAGE